MRDQPLYQSHPTPLTVLWSDLWNHAAASQRVLVGTPGSLLERQNASGFRYYARQFYDADRRKREQYVAGPVGDEVADAAAEALRLQIQETQAVVADTRLLGRSGFQVADSRTWSTVAALQNHGIFRAGGVLVGSHAFGVLLNQMGVRAPAYTTEDVDLARGEALAFDEPPGASLLEMLRTSGIEFVEVPPMCHHDPATRRKERGRSRCHVDLLVPSPDDSFPLVALPELNAFAQGLPWLRYLLGGSQESVLLAREGCCLVRVPVPERFAVHKLVVSQLRAERSVKSSKDVFQAAVLLAALAENHPGAIEEAIAGLPVSCRTALRTAVAVVTPLLEPRHPAALEALEGGRAEPADA